MAWQFLFHRSDIENSSISISSACPSIKELIILVFLLLVLIPFNTTRKKPIEYFINFHLFPFRRHKISFGRRMSVNRERIIMFKLDAIVRFSNCLRSHFSTSDSIYKLKLFIWETNISLIELISDGSPPIFVFWFFDEFCDHIILFLFGNFL